MSVDESSEGKGSIAPARSVPPRAPDVFSKPPPQRGAEALGFVMDVPVEVTVEIGRRRMKIAEVLRLGAGSILELDKVSGEPLDVYVNDRHVARGEAVVIGDRYGVRITEVLVGANAQALVDDARGGSR